jgi:hypothetical protein
MDVTSRCDEEVVCIVPHKASDVVVIVGEDDGVLPVQ